MTLRDDLIEAGMEALANTDPPMEPPEYGIDELAAACLDAILTTLADRADEWCESSDDTKMLDRAIPAELIEALRA